MSASSLGCTCQNRDRNLQEFFKHENQACPPLFQMAVHGVWLGVKSHLTCLEERNQPKCETPPTTFIVLEEAVIIQMLQPSCYSQNLQ